MTEILQRCFHDRTFNSTTSRPEAHVEQAKEVITLCLCILKVRNAKNRYSQHFAHAESRYTSQHNTTHHNTTRHDTTQNNAEPNKTPNTTHNRTQTPNTQHNRTHRTPHYHTILSHTISCHIIHTIYTIHTTHRTHLTPAPARTCAHRRPNSKVSFRSCCGHLNLGSVVWV